MYPVSYQKISSGYLGKKADAANLIENSTKIRNHDYSGETYHIPHSPVLMESLG